MVGNDASTGTPSQITFSLKQRVHASCYVIDDYEARSNAGALKNHLRIEAMAVITMVGSKRMKAVWRQLKKFCPCNHILIFWNKGYKTCNKSICRQSIMFDVIDAYKTVFEYVNCLSPHGRFLVAEDDFFWSSNMLSAHHLKRVDSFLSKHVETVDHYFLGCIPLLTIPTGYHWRLLKAGGAHAVVHTAKGIHKYLTEYDRICMRCPDATSACLVDTLFTHYGVAFGYYRPLAYQTFPITPNMTENWPLQGALLRTCTSLETRVHPWYDVFYCLQLLPMLLLVVCLVVAASKFKS